MRDLTLSDFPFVASLADSDYPSDRRIWLRVACDHFVATGTTDREAVERFADAIVRQIERADLPTVLETARTLAPCARVPVRLLVKFQSIGPEVSDYVLEHGAALASQNSAKRSRVEGGKRPPWPGAPTSMPA